MQVNELGLPEKTIALLQGAGLHTVEDVQAAGHEELLAIDGIGPKTADEILDAVAIIEPEPEPEPEEPEPEPDAESGLEPDAEPEPDPEPEPEPSEWVTVRNTSGSLVLVGHKYLFPTEVREIHRSALQPGLTIIKE